MNIPICHLIASISDRNIQAFERACLYSFAGKLQFIREMREHFLELAVQGRIPCKVRGYGSLSVDWFRKVGPRDEDIVPIRPPNQVEGGTLIIQLVQKEHEGDYVCVARSDYKNTQVNMTVKVIVGGKVKPLLCLNVSKCFTAHSVGQTVFVQFIYFIELAVKN